MTAVVRGDAYHIPLADNSVDAIVTSPPYFALRSYRDDGDHYDGQLGSEPTPQEYLEGMWAASKECFRVLKPSGSMFVNLGDKRSGSGGHNNAGISEARAARAEGGGIRATRNSTRRNAPDRYNQAAYGRPKSKMLLPHRYAIGCEDGLADPDGVGWIVRQDMVWNKPNGLPESVVDRVRDSHEYWFHLVKQERYFSAVDEIREAQGHHSWNGERQQLRRDPKPDEHSTLNNDGRNHTYLGQNPLGKLPGSVWTVPSEPLSIPEWLGVDHFAAFPQEIPRRLILGWTPSGICTVCGEGRRPVVDRRYEPIGNGRGNERYDRDPKTTGDRDRGALKPQEWRLGRADGTATITGYACACTPWRDHPGTGDTSGPSHAAAIAAGAYPLVSDGQPRDTSHPGHAGLWDRPKVGPWREYLTDRWTPPPTRPAVVLDVFGGTGTTAMVARALGRTGISLDLSADYCRLAAWRIFQSGHAAKTRERTNKDRQGTLL